MRKKVQNPRADARISHEVHDKLIKIAKRKGIDKSELVRIWILEKIEEDERKEKR